MTWLDIAIGKMKGLVYDCGHPEHNLFDDAMRMARVIRELVESIKLERELPMSYATEEAAEESWNAAHALSSDVKELLE